MASCWVFLLRRHLDQAAVSAVTGPVCTAEARHNCVMGEVLLD